MAKVTFNSSITGLSGKIDDWIYRRQNGQLVVSPASRTSSRKKRSTLQRERQRLFSAAAAYSRDILADPLHRAEYRRLAAERKTTITSLLIGDYLNPPVVTGIELSAYQRKPGGLIRVSATSEIEVTRVKVAVRDGTGALVEDGAAAKDHGIWNYETKATAPAGQVLTVTVTAWDRPGHQGTRTEVVT